MAINLKPVQAGWHNLTVDVHNPTFQAALSDQGLLIYVPPLKYIIRDVARKVYRARNKAVTALYPLHPVLAMLIIIATIFWVNLSPQNSWVRDGWLAHFLWYIDECFPYTHYFPLTYRLCYLSAIAAFLILLLIVSVQRLIVLRVLLHYKGWMYDPFGKPSKLTKIWGVTLKYLFIRRGKLLTYSFQHALPRLPVPDAASTVQKYIRSVTPLLSTKELEALQQDAHHFVKVEAPKLQGYLVLKSWLTDNYISDWWRRFVYLRGRGSIFVESNYYAIGARFENDVYSTNPITRAANLLHIWGKIRQLIEWEQLEPTVANGVVPLCMDQYKLMFSTTRIPHREEDWLKHLNSDDSRHAVIFYKGYYYRLELYTKNNKRLLTPYEFQVLLHHIVDSDAKVKARGEKNSHASRIAALTTLERAKWSEIRENHFSTGLNLYSLNQIENSIFTMYFEDVAPEDYDTISKTTFVGNGANRWCDKSINHVIFSNGKNTIHAEHSWADAPPLSHMMEKSFADEAKLQNWDEDGVIRYDPDMDPNQLPVPSRLRFHMTEDLANEIDAAHEYALSKANDLDIHVLAMTQGKGAIKKCRINPDSFIQMALQLAFFRDQGQFGLTYESSMTRFYRNGRTETIRSLSVESCAFVHAMENSESNNEERKELLFTAVEQHANYSKDCMCGQGVDRHLFAMYVVARGREMDCKFLSDALQLKWRLSTSQIPHRQYDSWPKDDRSTDKYLGLGGGFGPVSDDGYGVCYIFANENVIHFHLSSKKSCDGTDSKRFAKVIEKAFNDLLALFKK